MANKDLQRHCKVLLSLPICKGDTIYTTVVRTTVDRNGNFTRHIKAFCLGGVKPTLYNITPHVAALLFLKWNNKDGTLPAKRDKGADVINDLSWSLFGGSSYLSHAEV